MLASFRLFSWGTVQTKSVSQPSGDIVAQRRQTVATLASAGKSVPEIVSELRSSKLINPRTGKSFSRQTIRGDMLLAQAKGTASEVRTVTDGHGNNIKVFRRPVAETIGTWTYTKPMFQSRYLLNVDNSWKDYAFWDALRRGTAPGFEIGGMFCTPIAQTIASYALGSGMSASLIETATPADALPVIDGKKTKRISEDGKPTKSLKAAKKTVATNGNSAGKQATNGTPKQSVMALPKPPKPTSTPIDYTNVQLRLFMKRMQSFFQTMVVDDYCLGNQYVAINPDCTLSILSPDTVTVEYSASDYRYPVRYIVRIKMEKAVVEDVFTAEKRVITVKYYDSPDAPKKFEYENLIGRIPIVHFPCDRSANEISGRPIYEAALPVMRQYDDLIQNIIEGVKLLGNPIPAFVGLDNVTEAKANNSTAINYLDENGIQQTEYVMRLDRNTGIYLGKGGDAKMVSTPVGFTKDSLDTLRQLFLLLLNHTRIPEYVWGGAISSSKASAEVQQPPFIKYIQLRRLQLEGEGADPALGIAARGGFLELIDVWLRTYKLLNPAIVVGPVRIDWGEIDITDSQWRYMWGALLNGSGQLELTDTLKLAGFWDDPAAVAQRASGGANRPPKYDQYDAMLRAAKLEQAQYQEEPHDGDEPPFKTDWVTPMMDQDLRDKDGIANGYDMTINGPLYWQNMLGGG